MGDEERTRMEREEKHKLGADAWKQRLQDIMAKVPDAKDVPEGHCCKGCGRQVAPGRTAAGKPFRTCCRGCAMGFGHDLTCGNIDPSKTGEGMCSNGVVERSIPENTLLEDHIPLAVAA